MWTQLWGNVCVMWHCGMHLSMWGLWGLAEGQTQTNPARQAEHAPSNIFSLVPAVCVILNPGTKGTHYFMHKKIMIIQPLKCCESLFVSFPQLPCLFIQKPHGCLLGTTSAYISSFHSVGHFICFTYISLTNSLRHLETRRHLAFLSPVRTFLSLLWLYAWLMVSRRLLGSQCTAVGSVCWQDINRNGYPYFLCAVGTHTLSFNQFITRSAWAAILSFSRQPM